MKKARPNSAEIVRADAEVQQWIKQLDNLKTLSGIERTALKHDAELRFLEFVRSSLPL